jgi:fucose 4-O-acetylase-like acetyltransferase
LVFQLLYVLYERAAIAPVGTLEWSSAVAGVLAAWSASFWVGLFFYTRLARRVDGFWTTVLQGPNR